MTGIIARIKAAWHRRTAPKMVYTFEEIMHRRWDKYAPMPPTDHDCHTYAVLTWWDLLDVSRWLGYTRTRDELTESYGPNKSLGIGDFDHQKRIVTFLSPESTSISKTEIPFPSEMYGDGLWKFLAHGPFEHPHLYVDFEVGKPVKVPLKHIDCYRLGQTLEHDDTLTIIATNLADGTVTPGRISD